MQSNSTGAVSLIGALFVSEGLVTREQMDACLFLQAHGYPNMPLGQIMLRCGYITSEELLRVTQLQRELKVSMFDMLETDTYSRPATDLTALMLYHQNHPALLSVLLDLGVGATVITSIDEFKHMMERQLPDVFMIDSTLIQEMAALPALTRPIILVPSLPLDQLRTGGPLPTAFNLLSHQFDQVREQRRIQRYYEQFQLREYELSVISTIIHLTTSQRLPREALHHLMFMIRKIFNVEAGTLYRMDLQDNQLIFEVVFGPNNEMLQQKRLPTDRGIAGWVVRNNEPLLIPNVSRDLRFEAAFDRETGFQTCSVLCVPLSVHGKVRGVLQLINKLDGPFTAHDMQLLRIIASLGTFADILIALDSEEPNRTVKQSRRKLLNRPHQKRRIPSRATYAVH